MNTTFHDSHLDTLMKLKALVEKHGMKIRFGTTNSEYADSDLGLLDDNVPEDVAELLGGHYDEIVDGNISSSQETIWFELYQPMPNEKQQKYHTMTFTKTTIRFRLKDDWEEELYFCLLDEDDEDDDIQNDYVNKLIEFINDNEYDDTGYVDFSESPTIIRGFGNDEPIVDGRVYRDGMALHFFTELVCNYLKEPMINNTY